MHKSNFSSLGLQPDLLKNLELLGFSAMTDIQSQALPVILAGQDVVAQAQTGSGKTVAFGLGILSQADVSDPKVQSLILCPTRELANQVAVEVRRLGRLCNNLKVLTLCGGTPIAPQYESLEHGAHIIVGTPGRILDHINRGNVDLSQIKNLILDEADRMLEMGFSHEIDAIIDSTPRSRQTLLFSATFPEDIASLSRHIQNKPVYVKTNRAIQNADIDQFFFATSKEERRDGLLSLLAHYRPESSIVFCNTKIQCDEVAAYLLSKGLVALAMHGDLDQETRDEVMVRFANRSVSILVATDVAARGIDVKELSAVINFELSKDPEVHVHRIGRTGRAGQKGLALSLYSPRETYRVKAIETYMGEVFNKSSSSPGLLQTANGVNLKPEMKTLKIYGGKKHKLRPGDILGALTGDAGIDNQFIGKINIFNTNSYVAIQKDYAEAAYRQLVSGKIKNRNFGMKVLW